MESIPSAADQARLQYSLSLLETQGKLEYTGEYGAEITTFIPFVAWLKREGHLRGRRIRTYAGMRPYYFFLDDDDFEVKTAARRWVPVANRYWPANSTYTATASPWHVYPDYRSHFRQSGSTFARPVLFVQNKFTVEWDSGPINYIPLRGLFRLLKLTEGRFDVVYSRPRSQQGRSGYSQDHNRQCEYPDRAVIAQFGHVLDFEARCAQSGCDYNQTKLETLANSHVFVAVQGGGAHVLACFGDSLLLLMDRDENLSTEGREYPHAYQRGPYKYLASNPPLLLVARTFREFAAAVEVVGRAVPRDSQIHVPLRGHADVERLVL